MKKARGLIFGRYDYAAFASFLCYAACSVSVPMVLVPLAVSLGFPLDKGGMELGGILQSGRSAAMVGAMLVCGFISGKLGLRRSLGGAALLMGASLVLAAFSQWYWMLFAMLLAAGLGEGVIEGLATPFVQELHRREPGRYINFAHSFWSVGVTLTMLGAGALLTLGVSWRVVVAASGLGCLLPAALLFWKENPARPYPEAKEKLPVRTICGQAFDILRRPHFWLFFAAMFVAGGGEYCLTFWGPSYIQLCYGSSAFLSGMGTAVFAAGMFVGRAGGGMLVRQKYLCHLIVGTAVAGTLVTALPPLLSPVGFGHPAGFEIILSGLFFVCGLTAAPYWPSIQSYAADRLPGTDTTMLFILLSCAGVPGCGFFTWLMGRCGDAFGLRYAFYLVPACFACVGVLIAADWIYARRQRQKAARS